MRTLRRLVVKSMEIELNCVVCEKKYIAGRRDGKTCSSECRKLHKRKNAQKRRNNGHVLRNCDVCGTQFSGRMGAKRCSEKCSVIGYRRWQNLRNQAKSQPAEPRICVYCGTTYLLKANRKTCSSKCSDAYRRQRARERAGQAKRTKVKHRNTGKGRGQDQRGSKNPTWSGGHTTYREIGFDNLVNLCNRCGSTRHLVVHHRDRDRSNPALDNLEILCRSCHLKEHAIRDQRTGQFISTD